MATSPAETAKLQALDALLASANAGKQSGFYWLFEVSRDRVSGRLPGVIAW